MIALLIYPDRAVLSNASNNAKPGDPLFMGLVPENQSYWEHCVMTSVEWENGEAVLPDLKEPKIGHYEPLDLKSSVGKFTLPDGAKWNEDWIRELCSAYGVPAEKLGFTEKDWMQKRKAAG